MNENLHIVAERSKGLDSCQQRAEVLLQRLEQVTADKHADTIQWYETRSRTFLLHLTPMNIANIFSNQIAQYKASWIFTSATLSVAGNFDFFAGRLGIDDALKYAFDSPFDFPLQALCYVPQELPEPSAQDYTLKVLEKTLPVLKASRGRAFVLFTSYRALNIAAEALKDKIDFPLLVQGDMPRNELLTRFRELGNAVLLGTGSFWEGVDVRGAALSCVIIDKLPFASPDDPVLQARIDALRQTGNNPFMDYQVPNAAISLKQGAGRLIRDVSDTGVLVLCDPRLYSKPYGRIFLKSIPAMRMTRKLQDVEQFFKDNDNT